MNIQTVFGNILKLERQNRKLSQEKLAFGSDLDRTYISLLERGLRQPTLISIFNISNALDVNPSYLVSKVEDEIAKQHKIIEQK